MYRSLCMSEETVYCPVKGSNSEEEKSSNLIPSYSWLFAISRLLLWLLHGALVLVLFRVHSSLRCILLWNSIAVSLSLDRVTDIRPESNPRRIHSEAGRHTQHWSLPRPSLCMNDTFLCTPNNIAGEYLCSTESNRIVFLFTYVLITGL